MRSKEIRNAISAALLMLLFTAYCREEPPITNSPPDTPILRTTALTTDQ